ncbi:AAA family ATPase [Emticicia sp. SJ17W-69]|uniref:AAA family ATPase n=1 Tax=Emticicia sp. SJ17W-69 TaxID=3421657 RepID=UPI003EB7C7E5
MRIESLYLKNIGPFLEANLDFIGSSDKTPVTIITGENGTGKTIVLDAIRAIILGLSSKLQRNIVREKEDFQIDLFLNNGQLPIRLFSDTITSDDTKFKQNEISARRNRNTIFGDDFGFKFSDTNKGKDIWITNYWTSKISNEKLELKSLTALDPKNYLIGSLDGEQSNVEVLKIITYFDYLKSSDNPKEKKEGEFLFETLKKIIKLSLFEGEFRYVERKTLMPIVSQNGFEVSLDKLSSGNLYLIQRLVTLLGQMYSVYTLNNLKLEEMLITPGLLLIDEAENHLHPKWQKTFLKSILEIFPNLQIIVTTHSPFIVSSVENARVYVCKSMKDHSVVVDETDLYANMPIEEILSSPIFETLSFNETISKLIEERKIAIEAGDLEKSHKLEEKLKEINPEYFSYFDVNKLLESIAG